ncbi:MAG TPA: asparagine synthase (glutamine-hydrolyzing) [Candidatus Polarisedimenticolia bacterium]|nr:asparagine synthase (glutamine-hydrolyzing) [Candidatus Polarisedimenticolia bacterium]
MCGICGIVGIESAGKSETVVRRMMAAMVHRGPDESGFFAASPVAIGMRRLSILDLPGGSQPIWNERGTLAVVFNGEIYNFRELRRELEAAGHRFRTRSDTEVVVHAYEEWGRQCVERLNGMFAFAVVETPQGRDGQPECIFLARDRLGIKPLYYAVIDGTLVFASEVRALLASGYVPSRLSHRSISAYLLFGAVCEPRTLIEGVASLPPGHSMSIAVSAPVRLPEPAPYWHPEFDAPRKTMTTRISGDQAYLPVQRVRSLLEDAVATHLVADVPVGVFLSSGLDSTTLAALASRVRSGIHTFTVAFPDSEFSEAEKARRTARCLGTEHSELTLSDAEMVARLDEAVAAFDQPSMDGINTYFVSWAARQAGLKVALSGLGSDELFGGYTSFRATSTVARIGSVARLVPQRLRSLAASGAVRASGPTFSRDRWRKASAAWFEPGVLPHPYFFTRLLFPPQAIITGLRGDSAASDSPPWQQWLSESARQARLMDRFTAVSWLELRSYLLNMLLRDTDAMSMRHSLEVRVPFLDSPLVEYVLSLPESVKRRSSRPKALLIAALGDLLPEEIVAQKKRTFTFPWENWLRGPLGQRVAAGLTDWSPILQSHLDGGFAVEVWNDFLKGRTTWSRPWSLYVLNEWVKHNAGPNGTGVADDQRADAVAIS